MKHYTKRATDTLDLIVVVDVYLTRIRATCKSAVAHTAQAQVERLKATRAALERDLAKIQGKVTGVITWLKNRAAVGEIKKRLSEINNQIVTWINSVYRYFLA